MRQISRLLIRTLTGLREKVQPCSIVNHFFYVFSDTDDPSKNFKFINNDQLNNKNRHSLDETDDLLLQKVILCIATLSTIHKRLNSTRD